MKQQKKIGKKPAIIAAVAASVVLLGVVLGLLLTGLLGNGSHEASAPTGTVPADTYELYWNLDAQLYATDGGLSSREKEADGYYHMRFFKDGEIITLKVVDATVVNVLDKRDLTGLAFDEDGIVVGAVELDDMPLEKVGWRYYVRGASKTKVNLDSSIQLVGQTLELELEEDTQIYDMTGLFAEPGIPADLEYLDRVYVVRNLFGKVTHIFIFFHGGYTETVTAECEHCKSEQEWTLWDKPKALPQDSGHYILQDNIDLSGQMSINEEAQICLDLNGKTVTGKDSKRLYSLHNPGVTLAIMDSSERQTGKLVAKGVDMDEGCCVWVRYGSYYMYGGTLDASGAVSTKSGTAVRVNQNAVFSMRGGEIIGGTSKYRWNDDSNKATNGLAGSVAVYGVFNLFEGTIRGGSAEPYITTGSDGSRVYSQGVGGSIFISESGIMNMHGGEVLDGVAGNFGGNFYLEGQLNMTGGRIAGGKCTAPGKNGGNIYIGGNGVFNLESGEVTGGICYNYGGNIYVGGTMNMSGGTVANGVCIDSKTGSANSKHVARNVLLANGTLNMSGGTIRGYVQAADTKENDGRKATINLSGAARITGAAQGDTNLSMAKGGDGVTINVSKLYNGAQIGINAKGIFTTKTTESNKAYFIADDGASDICYVDGCLAVGKMGCLCGSNSENAADHVGECTGEKFLWEPWTKTNELPSTTGNYFLTQDVTTAGQAVISSQHVKLDLNGHNIMCQVRPKAADAFRLYRVDKAAKTDENGITLKDEKGNTLYEEDGSLVLTDSAEIDGILRTDMSLAYEGELANGQALRDAGNYGMILWARYGKITMYGGILDGSKLTGNESGLVVRVNAGSTFELHGGTILGGTTTLAQDLDTTTGEPRWIIDEKTGKKTEPKWAGGVGGAVGVYGTMNMTGGTITGGRVCAGVGVMNPDTGITCLPAGVGGGNVYVEGTFNMSGGTISDGQAFDSQFTKVLADGTSAQHNSGGSGGNVVVTGTMNMTGGQIIGGSTNKADAEGVKLSTGNGGNLRVSAGATLNMSGGTISGGSSDNSGGNLVVYGTMNMSGGKIEKGSAVGSGHNVYSVNGVMNMTGGQIAGDVQLFHNNKNTDVTGLTVSGTAVITGGEKGGLLIPDGKLITVEDMQKGAQVCVSASGIFTQSTKEENKAYFTADGDATVYYREGCLAVGRAQCGICAGAAKDAGHVCADSMTYFQPWTSTNTLPNSTGFYYLTENVELAAANAVRQGANIVLDLNGYQVISPDGTNRRVFALRSDEETNLTVADSKGTGKISLSARAEAVDEGLLVWGQYASSNITLYGITVEAAELVGNSAKPGSIIKTLGSLTVHNCTILGNTGDDTAGISFTNKTKDIRISGSSINTTVDVTGAANTVLAGNVQLFNLQLAQGIKLNLAELDAASRITVVAAGIFTDTNGKSFKDCFTPGAAESAIAENTDGSLSMGRMQCGICAGAAVDAGHVCADNMTYFQPWTSANTLPNSTGFYYLTEKVELGAANAVRQGATIVLDLNGNQIVSPDGTNRRVFALRSEEETKLTVADSKGAGKISLPARAEAVDEGLFIWGQYASSSITLCGITVEATQLVGNTSKSGSIIKTVGDLAMYNCQILANLEDGVADIYVNNAAKSIHVEQSQLTAAVRIGKSCPAVLKGKVTISELTIPYGMQLDVSGLAEGSDIYLVDVLGVFTTETGNEINKEFFRTNNPQDKVVLDGTVLRADFSGRCLCGTIDGEHTGICAERSFAWQIWDSKDSLPNTTGDYILLNNINCANYSRIKDGNQVVLDLNGKTVVGASNKRVYDSFTGNGQELLAICDGSKSQGGSLQARGQKDEGGVVAWAKGTLYLYSGCLDASEYTANTNAEGGLKDGAAMAVSSGTEFYMYGGTIIGGTTGTLSTTVAASRGGAVAVKGTMHMFEGTITDGYAGTHGGNLYVSGTLNLHGGSIVDGEAAKNGGNVYLDGSATMNWYGGQIENGTAATAEAADLFVRDGAVLNDLRSDG